MLPVTQGEDQDDHDNYCRVHKGETIKYYCETCNAPICLPCTFLDHKGHQIEEIKNVRDSFNEVSYTTTVHVIKVEPHFIAI